MGDIEPEEENVVDEKLWDKEEDEEEEHKDQDTKTEKDNPVDVDGDTELELAAKVPFYLPHCFFSPSHHTNLFEIYPTRKETKKRRTRSRRIKINNKRRKKKQHQMVLTRVTKKGMRRRRKKRKKKALGTISKIFTRILIIWISEKRKNSSCLMRWTSTKGMPIWMRNPKAKTKRDSKARRRSQMIKKRTTKRRRWR